MSERRNFPADSKAKKDNHDNVGRSTVDSFEFMLDRITLAIDDNLRIFKNIPYTLAGVGVVLLLWRSNSLRRLKGVGSVPPRVYRENTRLPVRVVELRPDSVGVVHTPLIHRMLGLGQRYHADDVMRVRLSGVHFPSPVAATTVDSAVLPEPAATSAPSPPDSPPVDVTLSPEEYTAAPAPSPDALSETNKDKNAVADVSLPIYEHTPDSLDWMRTNLEGRVVRMTLLQKGDDPFVFLYQRKLSRLWPAFVNLQLVQLGIAEAAPVASPFLIKNDVRKLTALLLQAERSAEKGGRGMWKDARPSWRKRVRSIFWQRRLT